jgi:phospholipase/carboxylesterase
LPGYHWYTVPRVGYPDSETFHAAYRKLAEFHEETWKRTGIAPEQTVLGGFSMGSVMSYALGLAGERPIPAGILAFSGFIPTVQGWRPDLGSRTQLPVFISHGRQDPVIGVDFARRAHQLLATAGFPVTYLEADAGHAIDPNQLAAAAGWLAAVTSDRVPQR